MNKTKAPYAIRTVNGEILYVSPLTHPNDKGDVTIQIMSMDVASDDIIPVHKVNTIMVVPKIVLIRV